MKRFIKNNIKVFVTMIITTIVVGSLSVYAASQYFARDINFTPTNENFKKENGEAIENVEDALNELYENRNIKFGTPIYKSFLGNADTHEENMNISKGKYIINVIYEYQMANPLNQITGPNNSYKLTGNLKCESNNCNIKQINGYGYHPVSGTSVFNNNFYIHGCIETYSYIVKVNENDVLSTKLDLSWSSSGLSEIVAIQAIPIL